MPKHVPPLPGSEAGALPFSQVVEANGFVFLAGQVGNAPGGDGAVPGGIEAETRQMLDNVGRLLGAVGLSYRDVVKATVYLRDFDDFAAMNAVYRAVLPDRAADQGDRRGDRPGARLPGRDRGARSPLARARRRRYGVTTSSSIATSLCPRVATTSITRLWRPAAFQLSL